MNMAASTSLDALRRTLLGNRPCSGVSEGARLGSAWPDVHVGPSTLLVAALPGTCDNHEWYGWTNDSTLTIELATWGCIQLRNPGVMLVQGSYALLGVPLSRLPRGRLLVNVVDSGVPPVSVLVP
jgi:hypothetical protein